MANIPLDSKTVEEVAEQLACDSFDWAMQNNYEKDLLDTPLEFVMRYAKRLGEVFPYTHYLSMIQNAEDASTLKPCFMHNLVKTLQILIDEGYYEDSPKAN